MIPRLITEPVREALADTPVVLIHGPRQAGKSTLARQLAELRGTGYVTLDDLVPRQAALADPEAFVAGLGEAVVIDEVQLVPELFRAIKANVDRDRRPGRFLLTGSADITLLPDISESLAGRIERHTLWPLAETELRRSSSNLVERLFQADPPRLQTDALRQDYLALSLRGGFPEVVERPPGRRRARWFNAYVQTMVERDLRHLASIQGLVEMPRLLAALADRAAGLLNYTDVARDLDMDRSTAKRYIDLLELAFLIDRMPAWHRNVGKRLRKAAKTLFIDSGLLAHLLAIETPDQPTAVRKAGALLENFVVMELRKLLAGSSLFATPYHYRTDDGAEVDLVFERQGGAVVGLEVKAAAAVDAGDFRGLRSLRDTAGDDFVCGVILHAGRQSVAFEERLWAVPIAALWEHA